MKLFIAFIALIKLVECQQGSDFLANRFESNPPPLKNISQLEKCKKDNKQDDFLCVPEYYCDPKTLIITKKALTDGRRQVIYRDGNNDNDECEHYLEKCCKVPTEAEDSDEVSERSVNVTESPMPKDQKIICGQRNYEGVSFRIMGNQDYQTLFGEFPWMIALLKKDYNPSVDESLAICGGSLISPIIVLTAAHCLENVTKDNIKVRAGEWDTQTTIENIPYQERDVSDIIIHKKFNKDNAHYDIALLILKEALSKAKHISTVCLPQFKQRFETMNCFATGWGKDKFGKAGRYSTVLRKVQLPLVHRMECQKKLRNTELGALFFLHKSFVCAGGEPEEDVCSGDGGGPLVCLDPSNPKRYLQMGIVSWGRECGRNQVPGVYTDVAFLRNWIDGQLQERNFSTISYN